MASGMTCLNVGHYVLTAKANDDCLCHTAQVGFKLAGCESFFALLQILQVSYASRFIRIPGKLVSCGGITGLLYGGAS
jgi:hypothetical protein